MRHSRDLPRMRPDAARGDAAIAAGVIAKMSEKETAKQDLLSSLNAFIRDSRQAAIIVVIAPSRIACQPRAAIVMAHRVYTYAPIAAPHTDCARVGRWRDAAHSGRGGLRTAGDGARAPERSAS